MVRARAAFMACRFDENPHGHETQSLPGATRKMMEAVLDGDTHRQLFSEVLVAEDIDLGSRVHTLGYKCGARLLCPAVPLPVLCRSTVEASLLCLSLAALLLRIPVWLHALRQSGLC
jgi:hypothetical protein